MNYKIFLFLASFATSSYCVQSQNNHIFFGQQHENNSEYQILLDEYKRLQDKIEALLALKQILEDIRAKREKDRLDNNNSVKCHCFLR